MDRVGAQVALLIGIIVVALGVGTLTERGQTPTMKWESYWLGEVGKRFPRLGFNRPNLIDETTRVISNTGADANAKADAYATRARAYLRNGQWGPAQRDIETALRLKPRSPQTVAEIWMLQGFIHDMKNEHAAAISDFTQVLRAVPKESGFQFSGYFCRGVAHRQAGNEKAALADLNNALAELAGVQKEEVQVLSRWPGTEHRRAIAYIEESNRRMQASVLRARAETWRAEGNYENALSDYTHAISMLPTDPRLFAGRGQVHFLNGDWRTGSGELLKAASLSFRGPSPSKSRSVECGG